MKKLLFVIPVFVLGIISFTVSLNSTNNVDQLSLTEASLKAPSCRKFTDICPDGTVGYHCALSTSTILPLCRVVAGGACGQIWPCGNSND